MSDIVLPVVPPESYPQSRPAPVKVVGVEAARKAASDPTFKPASTIGTEFSQVGRVSAVTGANTGIGLEYAFCLAELGSTCYALDIAEKPSQEFLDCQKYIEKLDCKGSLHYKRADVTDATQVREVMESIGKEHGGLHVCVANAGIIGPVVDCHKYPVEAFRKVLDVNVTGVFLTIQAAVNVMLEHKIKGSIICTASMSGSIINRDMHWIPYTTSKAAVVQLARAMACELGQLDIRVNTISPGHIKTKLTEKLLESNPAFENFWAAQNPMNRIGAVSELRGIVAYLASDAASYTTGADFLVCGGQTAW